jgi:transcriptional regulator with XRE-family HTH domain
MSKCGKCWGTGARIDHARLGRAVRKRREASGVTLAALAKKLGISEGHLSLLEHGKRSWTEALYDQAVG